MATHPSTLAWKIPWTEEPGRLQSMGSRRVGHNWSDLTAAAAVCPLFVMPSSHLILCRPLLLLPSIFPSIRVYSNESALCIRWPKYWSFSFNISPDWHAICFSPTKVHWLSSLEILFSWKRKEHSRKLFQVHRCRLICKLALAKNNPAWSFLFPAIE